MKTKLVVYKNHTLGYIIPKIPKTVQILHSSPLKGSPTTSNLTSSFPIGSEKDIRLAGANDFEDFNVSFKGYDNSNEYEFLINEPPLESEHEITYQGITEQELQGSIDYCNNCLEKDMEEWERKEYEAVKSDYEFKLNRIKSNPYYKK